MWNYLNKLCFSALTDFSKSTGESLPRKEKTKIKGSNYHTKPPSLIASALSVVYHDEGLGESRIFLR
ncbi:hypothetical protein ACET3Z_019245 [Daucus carota]